MPADFDESKDDIAHLVQHFRTNLEQYRGHGYKEAQARQEFIDPLFIALGWDVHNTQRAAPAYREVTVEPTLEIEGHLKAPDYAFRIGREPKFYVEAKKPGVDLKADADPAYQLRRYSWTARLPLSILTDFEEFAVYDCRKRPSERERASAGRIQFLTFDEYPDRWREVWDVFSKEGVLGGAFDQFAGGAARRGTSEVDVEFLKEIEGWREVLARNFALRNPRLSVEELNDSVQRTIDRIVFLRMAEDRGMEDYGRLQGLADDADPYAGLVRMARQADEKYNSGLFDFAKDRLTPRLELDARVLAAILNGLYFPQSPYAFNVLPPEILGSVYERFLGKVIRLTPGHQAKVEEKPEVRKAGGVYYTPAYIVNYIVQETVGKQIAGKSPSQLKGYRVLDMACGSGSFLLGAYQTLMDHYIRWYSDNKPERHPKAMYAFPGPQTYQAGPEPETVWRLTTAEKKRILIEHIFGVDIDRQAVEVTKLSLLLKVLEGETDETLGKQMRLFRDRALPDLDRNIQCGNSLIGPDYFSERLLPDADELKRVNPFDWKTAFPEAMASGGYDAVIGNPPYVRIQTMKEWAPLEVEAYKDLYQSARSGNYDIYVVFVERGLSLLNRKGRLGFILPHKFFNARYGENLRGLVAGGRHLEHVVHFGDQQVFAGATTYTALLFLSRASCRSVAWVKVRDLAAWRSGGKADGRDVSADEITEAEWNFSTGPGARLFERLERSTLPLGNVASLFVGLQTDADDVFILEEVRQGRNRVMCYSKHTGREHWFEEEHLKRLLKGSLNIRRYHLSDVTKRLIFPYETVEGKSALISPEQYGKHFPLTWEYLEGARSRLAERNKGKMGREWYGYVYKKNHTRFGCPKLLVPSIARGASFAPDFEGAYYFVGSGGGGGGGYGIELLETTHVSPRYVLGLLNSKLLEKCLIQTSTPFRGGYYALNRQYIERLPIRSIDLSDPSDKARHDKMVSLVERMLELHKRRQAAGSDGEREMLQRQIDATDREIDALVYELYGLSDEEIKIVEGS